MGEGQHEMLGDVANLCWYLQVEDTKHALFKTLHFTIWPTSYLANCWWPDPGKTHCDTGLKSHRKTEHEVGGYLAAGSPAGFWWGEPGKRGLSLFRLLLTITALPQNLGTDQYLPTPSLASIPLTVIRCIWATFQLAGFWSLERGRGVLTLKPPSHNFSSSSYSHPPLLTWAFIIHPSTTNHQPPCLQ